MTEEIPTPFEAEFPEEADFLSRVFHSGGLFKQPRGCQIKLPDLPPIKEVPRNAKCPCGSGLKAKKCHRDWCD